LRYFKKKKRNKALYINNSRRKVKFKLRNKLINSGGGGPLARRSVWRDVSLSIINFLILLKLTIKDLL